MDAPTKRDRFVRRVAGEPAVVQLAMLKPAPPLLGRIEGGSTPTATEASAVLDKGGPVIVQRQEVPEQTGSAEAGEGADQEAGQSSEASTEALIAETWARLDELEPWTVRVAAREELNEPMEARAIERIAARGTDLTGLGSLVEMDAFAAAMLALEADWSSLSEEERAATLEEAVNAALRSVGGRFVEWLAPADIAARAAFYAGSWAIRVRDTYIEDDAFDPRLVELVYHETRHCEQYYRALRLLAGREMTADEIAKYSPVEFPSEVIEDAVADPLAPAEGDTVTDEAAMWEAALISGIERHREVMAALRASWAGLRESWDSADQALEQFEDEPTDASRTEMTTALQSLEEAVGVYREAYGVYRDLVYEQDAHEVGIVARTVFEQLRTESE